LNLDEIIVQATRAGLKFIIKRPIDHSRHGNASHRVIGGNTVNKTQIVSLLHAQPRFLKRRKPAKRGKPRRRYPLHWLPLPEVFPDLSTQNQRLLIGTGLNQGPAIGWRLTRANYWLKFPSSTWMEQDAASANDLPRWQAGTHPARSGWVSSRSSRIQKECQSPHPRARPQSCAQTCRATWVGLSGCEAGRWIGNLDEFGEALWHRQWQEPRYHSDSIRSPEIDSEDTNVVLILYQKRPGWASPRQRYREQPVHLPCSSSDGRTQHGGGGGGSL